MTKPMGTETRFEQSDGKLHVESELPETKAKQGRSGRRVLTVLVAALVLAFIVWIPVEIWGDKKGEQMQPSAPAETQVPTAPPSSAPQTPAEADAQQR